MEEEIPCECVTNFFRLNLFDPQMLSYRFSRFSLYTPIDYNRNEGALSLRARESERNPPSVRTAPYARILRVRKCPFCIIYIPFKWNYDVYRARSLRMPLELNLVPPTARIYDNCCAHGVFTFFVERGNSFSLCGESRALGAVSTFVKLPFVESSNFATCCGYIHISQYYINLEKSMMLIFINKLF